MKVKKLSSHLSMILLAITLSHCSTPTTTFKKDDRGQFKDDILEVDPMKEPELHSSSSLLLEYQKGIQKIDKRKTRGPASIESAESFLEETDEDSEGMTEFEALTKETEE